MSKKKNVLLLQQSPFVIVQKRGKHFFNSSSLPLFGRGLPCFLFANQKHCFDRVGAPPHAAVRGGVPAVCFPLDEQPFDEGAAAALHNQTMGHLPGTQTRSYTHT